MEKKIILKEETEWVKLTPEETLEVIRNEDAAKLKYQRQGCELKKVGSNTWYKKCASTPPVSTLAKYTGQYESESTLIPNFEIVEDTGKLYMTKAGVKKELENISEDKFKGSLGVDFEIEFTLENGTANGGKLKIRNTDYNFKKKGGGYVPPPPNPDENSPELPFGLENVNWRKVAKDVWQALKDAGHYVAEKAGDFWVLLTTDGKPVKDYKTKFECIKNYTTAKQYYDPTFGNDGKRYYAILDMDFPVLKRPTKIEFYDDGTARFLYDDVNKVEQVVVTAKETGEQIVLKGTWGCQKDGKSFYMKLDNGEIIPWGNGGIPDKTDNGTNLDGGNTGAGSENLPKLKKFSEVCPSIKACPTEKQRKEGKAFKLCMKCDEIKKIQESPRFKSYYFSLLKGYGKKEESDGIFGPIMQKAVYNYQESTGIKNKYGKTTGMIGPLTYADIMKPVEVKPEDPNKNKIEQTEPPEPNEKKELQVITKDTKL